MKNWFKFLLPVTIVLAALVLGQKILNIKNKQPIKSQYFKEISNIKEWSVSKIVIKDGKGELTISKNGPDWFLNDGKKADASKISQLLMALLNPDNNYELISQDPLRSGDFGLASTSATLKNLSLSNSNQTLLSVKIGDDSYPGTFIQIENRPEVYLTSQSLSTLISSDPKKYLETPKLTK